MIQNQIRQYARKMLADHYRREIERFPVQPSPANLERLRADRARLATQIEDVEDAIGRGEWESALWQLPRRYRWDFFALIQYELSDTEYGHMLAEVWQDTEWPSKNLHSWIQLFTNPRLRRELLMDPRRLGKLWSERWSLAEIRAAANRCNKRRGA
jgi:hypothetical protein